MTKNLISSDTHFSLAIDQKRDLLLNFLVQMAMEHPDYSAKLARNDLTKTAESLYTDMAIGDQIVIWCNVTGCKGGYCEHKAEAEADLKSPSGFTTISRKLDKKKSKTFTIEFDKDLEYILKVMTENILKMDGFAQFLLKKGLANRYQSFLREWSDKSHEAGMCIDPNCTYYDED